MKFIKEHSYDIVKLYINQLGIAIFAFLLYTAVDTIMWLKILVSVFSTLFLYILLYCALWDLGAADKIRIDAGRLEPDKRKGLKIAAVAYLPNLLFAGLCTLTVGFYMLGFGEAWRSVCGVFNLITRFTESMYLGILQGIFGSIEDNYYLKLLLESIGYTVLPLLSVLVSHIGYTLGSKDIKIFPSVKKATK